MSLLDAIVKFFYGLFGYRRVAATDVLSSAGGTRIANGSVTLSYAKAGSPKFTQDGTGVTDATGTSVENVYLKKGTYTFRVSFAGGGGYRPSQAQTTATV